jgi:hypothetical protein
VTSVGRVKYSEPIFCSVRAGTGGGAPVVVPKETK